jgi:hypothetical protein
MQHATERAIDPQVRPGGIPLRRIVAAGIALLGFLLLLAPAGALDYTGRIDTRYLFRAGDNAYGSDLYNYHSLELTLLKGLTLSWYGGVIASLNDTVNIFDGTTEATDNALRNLQDASNPGQYINYTIYSAFLKYDTGLWGVSIGRMNPVDYDLTRFDGVMAWVAPLSWLKLEAFGGLPWHYAFVAHPTDIAQYWESGEVAAGGGATVTLLDDTLRISVKYQYLQENTRPDGLISSSAPTYLAADSLSRVNVSYSPADWLNAGAGASALGISPLSVNAWASGAIESLYFSYSVDFQSQLMSVSAVSDRLTEFSALLTASSPYLDASVTLTENVGGFLPRGGFLSDAELELSYEHRQPVFSSDLSMFNPQYDQFRVGTLLGAKGGWTLQVFYSLLLTSNIENTLNVVGGEIGKKWSAVDIRLGSSFNASQYQTDYTQTILEDSFYAQEYYVKAKVLINRSFDVSLKAAYENILLTSITSGQPLNPDVDYTALTVLNGSLRNYFRLDLRAGFRY